MTLKDVDGCKKLKVISKKKKEIPAESDFDHCNRDFAWKQNVSHRRIDYQPNCKLISSPVHLENNITKNRFLEVIAGHTKKVISEGANNFVIYYSGHGNKNNGAWMCKAEKGEGFDREEYMIELHEVINTVHANGYRALLEVISDSCHSGKKCEIAS